MFYHVRVSRRDLDCLRFLWRPDGNLEASPQVYFMVGHLFGAVTSHSSANYALHRTAEDNRSNFRDAVVNTIMDNFYDHDCLGSVKDVNEAVLIHDLRNLCQMVISIWPNGFIHITLSWKLYLPKREQRCPDPGPKLESYAKQNGFEYLLGGWDRHIQI